MWFPVLSALLGIVAFLPFNFYPVAFVFLVPLFIFFEREEKLWRLIAGALLFRFIFSMGVVYFTLEPILWIFSLLIFLGLPFFIWLFKKLSVRFCLLPPAFCLLFALPFSWTFFDLLQAHYSIMPTYIATAGNALGSSPFLGLASLGGFTTLTFFVALVNTLVVALILAWQAWRLNRHANAEGHLLQQVQKVPFCIIATLAVLITGWQFSQFELRQNAAAYAALPHTLAIAAVSTNNAFTETDFPALAQELSKQKADLIILPENMSGRQTSRHDEFPSLAKQLQTPVLAAYDTIQDAKKYGSAVLFDTQGAIAEIHNKNRLTFIGEYWPFGSWHPSFYDWLRARDPHIGTYAIFDQQNADAVGERNLLSLPANGSSVLFAAPICLEAHYPSDLAEYTAADARFIINPSSNRWLGTGLDHFVYLASNMKKIASVSLQLPIILSGVDDLAGVILPDGQTQLLSYKTADKNYTIFSGIIRY